MSDAVVFGYWGVRGRGQPLRHLLAYSGLKWEEKIYRGFESYFGERDSLGVQFPNLPFLIDGDIKIS